MKIGGLWNMKIIWDLMINMKSGAKCIRMKKKDFKYKQKESKVSFLLYFHSVRRGFFKIY